MLSHPRFGYTIVKRPTNPTTDASPRYNPSPANPQSGHYNPVSIHSVIHGSWDANFPRFRVCVGVRPQWRMDGGGWLVDMELQAEGSEGRYAYDRCECDADVECIGWGFGHTSTMGMARQAVKDLDCIQWRRFEVLEKVN